MKVEMSDVEIHLTCSALSKQIQGLGEDNPITKDLKAIFFRLAGMVTGNA